MMFCRSYNSNFTYKDIRYENRSCFSNIFMDYLISGDIIVHLPTEEDLGDGHYIRFSKCNIEHFDRWLKHSFDNIETYYDIYDNREFWNVKFNSNNYSKKELIVILTLIRVIQENNLYKNQELIFEDLLEIESMGVTPFQILLIFSKLSRNCMGHNIFISFYDGYGTKKNNFSPYTDFKTYVSELSKDKKTYVNESEIVNSSIIDFMNLFNIDTKNLLQESNFNFSKYEKGIAQNFYSVLKENNFFIKVKQEKNAKITKSKPRVTKKEKEVLTIH